MGRQWWQGLAIVPTVYEYVNICRGIELPGWEVGVLYCPDGGDDQCFNGHRKRWHGEPMPSKNKRNTPEIKCWMKGQHLLINIKEVYQIKCNMLFQIFSHRCTFFPTVWTFWIHMLCIVTGKTSDMCYLSDMKEVHALPCLLYIASPASRLHMHNCQDWTPGLRTTSK